MTRNADWPVLTRYDQDHLARIALPLGGIGTGTVSLGGRGDLRDWEVVNRPAKGFTPPNSFFALYARPQGGEAVARALEGPIDASAYEGGFGAVTQNHGLPRFRNGSFEAAYPLGQVLLSDPDVPLSVRLQAFNPLIPADADSSGLPVAVLRYVLTNTTDAPVEAAICGNVQNFIGSDGSAGAPKQNKNALREDAGLRGLFMTTEGVDPNAEQYGNMALTTTAAEVTYRTAWPQLNWGDTLLDFWDDFSGDGRLEEREAPGVDAPVASLCASVTVPARGQAEVTFLLSWWFPNRMTWNERKPAEGECCAAGNCCSADPNRIGNYYTTRFADAWDAAARTAADLERVEASTVAFVRAFCESDLPEVVKEAALYNVSTLRTQTCFRTEDGRFWAWEGCADKNGCCHGSCTHVWNYEQATAFLFGEMSRSMRDTEFAIATRDDGLMHFRVDLPLARLGEWHLAAADGQMGCLMKLYRDWKLSGDEEMLRRLWPKARKALEFCWIPGGWDADRDGVMEGCQHNTMDVEYYGPNPQMSVWYLGALRACEEMARHLGEADFAATCRDLFERGSKWVDANLFNGDYYEHHVVPPASADAIAPGLRHESMGARDLSDPDFQIGAGCLIDQLVGQYMAEVCGLGYLLEPAKVRKALAGVMAHNFKENLFSHFNHLRTFALQEEAAMLMCSFPRGNRPKRPFPYANEVMTGFEYTAASHMLYEGMLDEGLRAIAAIRARYDGRKRSPFDEAECGHHYGRAMASWAAVLALTGFHYDAPSGQMLFAAADKPVRWFWSTGNAWGVVEQHPGSGTSRIRLRVDGGKVAIGKLALGTGGTADLGGRRVLNAGETVEADVPRA